MKDVKILLKFFHFCRFYVIVREIILKEGTKMARNGFKDSWEKFKKLSRKERLEYIWDYYRYHILGIVGAVFLAVILFPKSTPEPLLQIVLVNHELTSPFREESFTDYLEHQGFEIYEGCVKGLSFTVTDKNVTGGSEEYIALSVHLAVGQDIFMSSGTIFENLASQDVFADLSGILSEETLASYEGSIVYAPEELGGYPCGIVLTDHPCLEAEGYFEECTFAVFDLAPHKETAAAFAQAFLAP